MKKSNENSRENKATSKERNFDLIVVGAGSAGFSAAIAGADEDASIALINHGTIGGTCVNVGCIPSKTLIRAAEVVNVGAAFERFNGLEGNISLKNWTALRGQKDALVADMRRTKYVDLLDRYPLISLIEGRASLTDVGVKAGDLQLKSEKIILTTGSSPFVPNIPGLAETPFLTSTEAMELDALPASLVVIGGGAIACELGQMFSRFGVEVTIMCRSRLLPEEELEISEALENYLRQEGLNILRGVDYQRVSQDEKIQVAFRKSGREENVSADALLVAAGRAPNTAGLGLETAAVELDDRGRILVDEHMETSKPGIYAAGDVLGRDEYVYMAAYGAKIAARNALNNNSFIYDASVMPAIVFSDPQVARVGLTEKQARDQGIEVKTSRVSLDMVPRALAAADTRGFIKLVAEETSGRLIGAHILAPEGADSIQTAALAIKHGMTVSELGETIFPYLTTVEGLKLAAQGFDKDIAALSCCAG